MNKKEETFYTSEYIGSLLSETSDSQNYGLPHELIWTDMHIWVAQHRISTH